MSKRGDMESLSDILEALHRIDRYAKLMTSQKFMKDIKTQDAVVRNLEIIGEATKNISRNLKEKYPYVAWSDLSKVRDKLIHHYFGVNLDIVWGIVEESLPELLSQINKIVESEKKL